MKIAKSRLKLGDAAAESKQALAKIEKSKAELKKLNAELAELNKKKTKKKKPAVRNWIAVYAHNRRAGNHGDKRKESSRRACRAYKWKG